MRLSEKNHSRAYKVYPQNRNLYKNNAKATIAKLKKLDESIQAKLKDVREKPFIVFHDAYQYFEQAYGLNAVGSITIEPTTPVTPRRIKEIRQKLQTTDAKCVFKEPQFSDRVINTVIRGSNAKIGTLDPIGAKIKPGVNAYAKILEDLANNLYRCLL